MLVDYSSSEDESERKNDVETAKRPAQTPKDAPRKKSKPLPRLPTSFSPSPDDPAQHGGRVRARPFADGDYYLHVYVDLPNHLREVTRRMLSNTEAHAFESLHISLSHPVPLRRHMRDAMVAELKTAIGGSGGFRVSLAPKPVVYYNALHGSSDTAGRVDRNGAKAGSVDRGTPQLGGRAFLGLVVGAGTTPLSNLLSRVDAILKKHHLPVYHANPEFHTSLAWALVTDKDDLPFPAALLDELDSFQDDILAAQPKGGWEVKAISVKIAKDITRILL